MQNLCRKSRLLQDRGQGLAKLETKLLKNTFKQQFLKNKLIKFVSDETNAYLTSACENFIEKNAQKVILSLEAQNRDIVDVLLAQMVFQK